MTIEATQPIYKFRSISRIQDARPAARSAPSEATEEQRQLDLFSSAIVADEPAPPNEPAEAESNNELSVANLFEQFFADKVRRYDHDEDGLLNREEFTGSDEEFARLDDDEDGLIRAADLQRQFMVENPEMREMAEGFAGGLYDRILNAADDDSPEPGEMVEEFFAELVAEHDQTGKGSLNAVEFPGSNEEFQRIAGKGKAVVTVENLVDDFMNNNPDLAELQESLRQLRQMVIPPSVRPQQVDVYG